MNQSRIAHLSSKIFILLSSIAIGFVSIQSMIDPIATMDLVNVHLGNNDAISSIRGIYGGIGIVITLSLLHLFFKDYKKGLVFSVMFWSAYAISRVVTYIVDGPLGEFGSQWLLLESILSLLGMTLVILNTRFTSIAQPNQA